MKLFLKIVLGIVAVLVLTVGGALAFVGWSGIPTYAPGKIELKVDVTPERVEGGRRTVQLLCAGCHLDNDTGTLAGKVMPDLPAQFGWAHSANITGDPETGIGRGPTGSWRTCSGPAVRRDGRYTPPWMVKLPNMAGRRPEGRHRVPALDDPLVRPVKARRPLSRPSLLTKALTPCGLQADAVPRGADRRPGPADKVAHGRYLVQARAMCFSCHSLDFAKNDELVPERSVGSSAAAIPCRT
jgi:cytochrome c553